MTENCPEAIRTVLANNNDWAPIPKNTLNPFTTSRFHFSNFPSKIY